MLQIVKVVKYDAIILTKLMRMSVVELTMGQKINAHIGEYLRRRKRALWLSSNCSGENMESIFAIFLSMSATMVGIKIDMNKIN